ncbi:DUF488 domain-containing protein [Neobacillus fumarioli]|uniref:DUF488 domain-containing protein n=1 Tax=Neobacillus fumarioli TaxID=105229 RepID=UPI0008311AF4|nr:DUF488 domain-containing protein [Neobacillus fumarioli]
MNIFLKRVYEPFDEADGCRVLVDRLWPRGVSKVEARLDFWVKDAAPSSGLRKWFGHKPELFDEFRSRYLDELRTNEPQIQAVKQIMDLAEKGMVTLLYGAKDPVHNHAVVLYEELERVISQQNNG